MNKAQKDSAVKNVVLEKFGMSALLEGADAMQVASGSWLVEVGEIDGTKRFAEIKVVAKAEDFDLDDALTEFADKQAKAQERAAASEKKKAEDAAKKAKKEAEKAAKEAKGA